MATKAKKLDKYSDLQEILGSELKINAARLKFIVLLLVALIKVQSVNFKKLATGFDNPVDIDSNLRRIQRFFASFELDKDTFTKLLYKMLPVEGALKLSLDRTNWKFGTRNINILVLAVIYKSTALPLLWTFLGDKRGNSNQEERIVLLKRFIRLFGKQNIDFVTADRVPIAIGIIGEKWWGFLIEHDIRFFIRIKENTIIDLPNKGKIKAFWIFRSLPINQTYIHPKIICIKGHWIYLSGVKFINRKGKIEYLLVASFNEAEQALEKYKLRWQIESMFKAFKTAGFNLEDTHLKDYERLDRLLNIIALAFVWAYKVGIYREKEIKPIKIKKHGRAEKSIFAYGLEWLAQVFINQFVKLIKVLSLPFLSCT